MLTSGWGHLQVALLPLVCHLPRLLPPPPSPTPKPSPSHPNPPPPLAPLVVVIEGSLSSRSYLDIQLNGAFYIR